MSNDKISDCACWGITTTIVLIIVSIVFCVMQSNSYYKFKDLEFEYKLNQETCAKSIQGMQDVITDLETHQPTFSKEVYLQRFETGLNSIDRTINTLRQTLRLESDDLPPPNVNPEMVSEFIRNSLRTRLLPTLRMIQPSRHNQELWKTIRGHVYYSYRSDRTDGQLFNELLDKVVTLPPTIYNKVWWDMLAVECQSILHSKDDLIDRFLKLVDILHLVYPQEYNIGEWGDVRAVAIAILADYRARF